MSSLQKKQKKPSKTDNTNGQQKPWLFQPGQSGNPAGRPKGSRNKLAEDFLADAYAQWQTHGSAALEAMAKDEPAKFCQMVANLLPKESVFQDERAQISEIKLVIIDTARNSNQLPQSRVTEPRSDIRAIEHSSTLEHDDTKPEPVLIEAKPVEWCGLGRG